MLSAYLQVRSIANYAVKLNLYIPLPVGKEILFQLERMESFTWNLQLLLGYKFLSYINIQTVPLWLK